MEDTKMGDTRILSECARGYKLNTRVALYANMIFDQVVFIDRGYGKDGNDGSDWDNAVQTIEGAQDLLPGGGQGLDRKDQDAIARGRNYALIFQSLLTSGNSYSVHQRLSLGGLHLIGAGLLYGAGGGHESCFVTPPATISKGCGLEVSYSDSAPKARAKACSIEGIRFYNPDSVEAEHYHVLVQDPQGIVIQNCTFQGSDADGDVTGRHTGGIIVKGCEDFVFLNNKFYYCENAINLQAGPIRYAHKGVIERNVGFGCYRGVYCPDAYALENLLEDNRWLPKQNYGYTLTRGFDLSGNPSGNTFRKNYVGHDTKANAYYKGSGTNFWDANYYGTNVLYDGT